MPNHNMDPQGIAASERSSPRIGVRFEVPGRTDGDVRITVAVHNVSKQGILIETEIALSVGQAVTVELPEAENCVATVIWESAPLFGCRFSTPLSRAAISAAKLRNALPVNEVADTAGRVRDEEPLAKKLLRIRRANGLTRAALSAITGISQPSIWAWETGRTAPKATNLSKLAAVFNMPEAKLMSPSCAIDTVDGEGGISQGSPMSGDPDKLQAVIDKTKETIAQLVGVDQTKVKIIIEF